MKNIIAFASVSNIKDGVVSPFIISKMTYTHNN